MTAQKIYSQIRMPIKSIASTLSLLIFTVVFFEYSNLDLWVQDFLFDFKANAWVLSHDNSIAKLLFYDGIKNFYILFVLSLVVALLFFSKTKLVSKNKTQLLIVCASVIVVPLLINVLKGATNIPCPRDIDHFGGRYPYATLLTDFPADFVQDEAVNCYPAGHASGGFALMSLYFLFRSKKSKAVALGGALTLGWIVGSYKMLIGDHFLSHTVVTMLIAWIVILAISGMLFRAESRSAYKKVSAGDVGDVARAGPRCNP